MKKLLLLTCLVACTFSVKVMADNAQLFQLDQKSVSDKFQGLNNLENFVNQHNGITLSEMQANKEDGTGNMNYHAGEANNILSKVNLAWDPYLGIPSFWWGFGTSCVGVATVFGCWLGVAGVALVYFMTDDTEETKKAVWGCLAGGATGVAFYFIFWVAILGKSLYTF